MIREVEDKRRRTRFSKTFRKGKEKRVEVSVAPVHFREGRSWKEIDLTMRPHPHAPYSYKCDGVGYKPTVFEGDVAVRLWKDDEWLEMSPIGFWYANDEGERQFLGSVGIAPRAKVSRGLVQWEGLFGKVDFEYRLKVDGVKKVVTLHSMDDLPKPTLRGASRLEFGMTLSRGKGITMGLGRERAVEERGVVHEFESKEGKFLWSVLDAKCWDSVVDDVGVGLKCRSWVEEGGVSVTSVLLEDLRKANFPVFLDTDISEEQVPASADDARWKSDGSWETGLEYMHVGAHNTPFTYHMWMRFTSVPLPQGATIDSAVLSLYCPANMSDTTLNAVIKAQDEDDATQIASKLAFDAMSWTTAVVEMDDVDAWSQDAWEALDDMAAVVQEVVDRVGWSSGNAMGFTLMDNGSVIDSAPSVYRAARTYDYDDGSKAPKLNISYTEAAETTYHPSDDGGDAWEGEHSSCPGADLASWQDSAASEAKLSASDNDWETKTAADPNYPGVLGRIAINENPEDITQIDVTVEGFGTGPANRFYAYIWDDDGSSWTEIGNHPGGSDGNVAESYTVNPDHYVNAQGQIFLLGVGPAGSGITPGVVNVDLMEVTVTAPVSEAYGTQVIFAGA